ncbi:hypothetical protein SAMN04490248_103145 [Salinihabitans flavidus]|uniref:Uncharacterized protein n=1 Tax=Salinihabitans flavidus TaxID=569882 RepID=A0A1H8NEP8_9RHOB|nr:hypothetical protein [Salinihabitans flavidus]SEO28084.1 hypothetical protein SAMN04490248_103145 [Salinihabitans flavidus]
MQTLQQGYRALEEMVETNWDRMLFPAAIVAGLMLAAFGRSIGLF